jgi:hypothetical protein
MISVRIARACACALYVPICVFGALPALLLALSALLHSHADVLQYRYDQRHCPQCGKSFYWFDPMRCSCGWAHPHRKSPSISDWRMYSD